MNLTFFLCATLRRTELSTYQFMFLDKLWSYFINFLAEA